MPMTPEQRLEVLKKARAAKAAKKLSSTYEPKVIDEPKAEPKAEPKPKRTTKAKKEEVKTLDLTEDKHDVPDAEIDLILEPSSQEKDEIKKINNRGNPKPKPILKEPEPEEEVEIIEEVIKKPKKKKVIRRIIEEASSEEEEEIIYEKAPKRTSKPKVSKPRAAPPPRDVAPPRNPFFCY